MFPSHSYPFVLLTHSLFADMCGTCISIEETSHEHLLLHERESKEKEGW